MDIGRKWVNLMYMIENFVMFFLFQVHMCNKLASRHVRVGLAEPSNAPCCDICENAPGMICLQRIFHTNVSMFSHIYVEKRRNLILFFFSSAL